MEQTPAAMVEALARMRAVLAATGDRTAPGTAAGPEHVLSALTTLRELRGRLAAWEPELITAARELGVSWAGLAPALGVTSRQAAERRYLRLRPSAGGEPTGEGRVQAERDKRAGDRAVARWARENSGELRRLAGQVGALENLAGPARDRVDVVQRALADDDPATLLSPLADAHEHLEATHAHLAEKIRSVTDQTERLRRDTRLNRSRSRSSP